MIGIVPNEAAVLRLAGAVLLEVRDEWAVAESGLPGRTRQAQDLKFIIEHAGDLDIVSTIVNNESRLGPSDACSRSPSLI